MDIAILLYENMTALDAIGPYEVLSRCGNVTFVGERAGIVRTDTRALGLVADRAIDEVTKADILLLPGGPGDAAVRQNARLLDWVRAIDQGSTWTTSVCTGSLILGAAGLLRGRRATSHWASLETLRELGAEPVTGRYVEDGKVITAAGVSAGIDMALRLAAIIVGEDFAKMIQLGIEYDPAPPFDCGSPAKAPAHLVTTIREALARVAA